METMIEEWNAREKYFSKWYNIVVHIWGKNCAGLETIRTAIRKKKYVFTHTIYRQYGVYNIFVI
jgi:hypothetical protein